MDRVPNGQIRELCGMRKWVDEKIEEGVFRWFYPNEKNGECGECMGSLLKGPPQKR